MDGHLEYLSLLEELAGQMDQLTQLARRKAEAVRRDDLLALDDVMKQEQALSLALRGQEQKRLRLLARLGLQDVPLSGLAGRYPAQLQPQARQTADALRRSYDLYKAAAEVARSTLEINLHQIEQLIAAAGGGPAHGPGYEPPAAEPPKNMKTDFRA